MSGGVAYVLDVDGKFKKRCNPDMVDLEALVDAEEIDLVQTLIMRHAGRDRQRLRRGAAADWASLQGRLVKVMPREYKRALAEQAKRAGDEAARLSDPVVAAGRQTRVTVTRLRAPRRVRPMGKPTGFIEIKRKKHPTRPVAERVQDWREVYLPYATPTWRRRARAAWTAAFRSAIRAARWAT